MFGRSHDIDNSFSHDCEKSVEKEEKMKDLAELLSEYRKDITTFLELEPHLLEGTFALYGWEDDYNEIKKLFVKLLEHV